jgi:hypothetical protein
MENESYSHESKTSQVKHSTIEVESKTDAFDLFRKIQNTFVCKLNVVYCRSVSLIIRDLPGGSATALAFKIVLWLQLPQGPFTNKTLVVSR